jgi:cell division protease FtsH
MNNTFLKNLAVWLLIGFLVFLIVDFYNANNTQVSTKNISYSSFLDDVKNGNISSVQIRGNNILGKYNDGSSFTTYSPNDLGLIDKLEKNNIEIIAQPLEKSSPGLLDVLISWFPMLLLIGVWIFFMRQMQSGTGRAMGFGKSRAKLLNENKDKVTFKDVAGIDEAKAELEEIVEFLKDPTKFQRLGGKIPKGALLVGPPGTGKTLLARAIAGEANVPFFSISGSDFVEMFVGVGASRVRDMFEQGKKNAPCIIFIDEIDAVGRHRGAGLGGGNDEREQTLNQLLVEMDGFDATEGVILIAATNRPDVLDPALLRPGRIDKKIYIEHPDAKTRSEILKIHLQGKPVEPMVDKSFLIEITSGMSGAEIENLLNEGMLNALREDREKITSQDLESVISKSMVGWKETENLFSHDMIKRIAVHEIGHAVSGFLSKHHAKLSRVYLNSWSPNNPGYTVFETNDIDSNIFTKEKLFSHLVVLLSGRNAERVFFGESVTTGASKDFQQAYQLAEDMVIKYGMGSSNIYTFTSDKSKEVIDKEIDQLIKDADDKSLDILGECKELIDTLSSNLIDNNKLDRSSIELTFYRQAPGLLRKKF